MKNCDLIIKGKYVLPMNEQLDILEDGFVAVLGDEIVGIGSKEKMGEYQVKEVLDVGDGIVMPGLINTHTHLAMSFFRGLADDLPLNEWLEQHIWPAEGKYVNKKFVQQSSELGMLEMIKSGTTCFNDMYFFARELGEVANQAGMRAIVGDTVFDFVSPSFNDANETLEETRKLCDVFQENELVDVAVALHSIYTCNKENLIKASQLAREKNKKVHIHIAETKKEYDDCINQFGKTPVQYLDELGLLDENVISAHSVWLDNEDLDILAKRKVKISHNPVSNMKLASGVMPLSKMQERKITVSLGTDGVASNNTLDLFSDMKICALLHKVDSLNPTVASAQEICKMATIEGARALGLEKKIGSLEVGKKADIITIDLNKPHLTPIYNPYSHLVYCVNGSDVENMIINGRVIMKNREMRSLDKDEILKNSKIV